MYPHLYFKVLNAEMQDLPWGRIIKRITVKGDQSESLETKASANTTYYILVLGNIMK